MYPSEFGDDAKEASFVPLGQLDLLLMRILSGRHQTTFIDR